MVAATANQDRRGIEIPEGMNGPIVFSAIFHIALVVIAITGLPYFKKEHDLTSSAIPVEILPISELTTTNKEPVKAQVTPEKPPEEKPIQKETPPAPPKVEAVEPPKEITPPKPKVEAKPKPKPVVPPPPTEKLEKPPEPKPKPEEKPIEETQQQDFQSLLKNLQDSKPEVTDPLPESKTAEATPSPSPVAAFSDNLTMSELDALRQQLSQCWSIQAGARYAEELVVEVRMIVSPDRRVTSATIVDQWRYNQDSYFRAAADSAIRAVNAPQCAVLNLPADKYDLWKDIVVKFDPRDML